VSNVEDQILGDDRVSISFIVFVINFSYFIYGLYTIEKMITAECERLVPTLIIYEYFEHIIFMKSFAFMQLK